MENNKPRTIEFNELGKFEKAGTELGKLVDSKQEAYGDSVQLQWEVTKVLLKQYETGENNDKYLIPKSLMRHLLLITRIGDKINRIVSNPSGDRMSESPYNDIGGYGLLGNNMVKSYTHEIIKNHDKYIKEMNDIYKEDNEIKSLKLTFVVNGQTIVIHNADINSLFSTIVLNVLQLSIYKSIRMSKIDKWEAKINDVNIEFNKSIKLNKLENNDKIFISLKSGIGG